MSDEKFWRTIARKLLVNDNYFDFRPDKNGTYVVLDGWAGPFNPDEHAALLALLQDIPQVDHPSVAPSVPEFGEE